MSLHTQLLWIQYAFRVDEIKLPFFKYKQYPSSKDSIWSCSMRCKWLFQLTEYIHTTDRLPLAQKSSPRKKFQKQISLKKVHLKKGRGKRRALSPSKSPSLPFTNKSQKLTSSGRNFTITNGFAQKKSLERAIVFSNTQNVLFKKTQTLHLQSKTLQNTSATQKGNHIYCITPLFSH